MMGMFDIPPPAMIRETGITISPEHREYVLQGFFNQHGDLLGEVDPGTDAERVKLWERLTGMKWTREYSICDFIAAWGIMAGMHDVQAVSEIERAIRKEQVESKEATDATVAAMLLDARVPARHCDCTHDRLRGSGDRGTLNRVAREKSVVYIHGKTGSGKSYGAAKLIEFAFKHKQGSAHWVDTVQLACDLNPSQADDDSARRIGETRQRAKEVTILVLDDLGKSGRASADGIEAGALYSLVHEILENRVGKKGKVTLITSEHSPEVLARRAPASTITRITGSGAVIEFGKT